jgi:hypothetical protein
MAFQFKIQIKNIDRPPVWRRLYIPESITFERFHEIIQAAFGWRRSHLFMFSKSGYGSDEIVGFPDEEYNDPFQKYTSRAASEVRLSEIFKNVRQKYLYTYDFGDDWVHQITLEKVTEDSIINPALLAGEGACPPEDCGGPWGYANLLNILSDKKHPEHREMKDWLGLKPRQQWDPDYFDLEMRKILVVRS